MRVYFQLTLKQVVYISHDIIFSIRCLTICASSTTLSNFTTRCCPPVKKFAHLLAVGVVVVVYLCLSVWPCNTLATCPEWETAGMSKWISLTDGQMDEFVKIRLRPLLLPTFGFWPPPLSASYQIINAAIAWCTHHSRCERPPPFFRWPLSW